MNTTQGRVLTQLLEAAWKSFTEMAFSQTGYGLFFTFGLYMLILVGGSDLKTSRWEERMSILWQNGLKLNGHH